MPVLECDANRIRIYLEDPASELDEASLLEHLSHCSDCQKLMESIAGSDADWIKVKKLLKSGSEVYSISERDSTDESNQFAFDIARYVHLNPTDDPHRLGRIGTFEVMGLIGRGGMGIVLKAFDPTLHRTVAIKILDPIVARMESSRRRFARESRAMAAIAHEHIVPVYAVDEHRELPYIVMEYVPGGTLESRLAAGVPLSLVEIVRTTLQIAQGLRAAHRVGVIHRDIKPSNILLDIGTERIRVADFGLARELNDAQQTHSQALVGTPLFMSPEQVRGEVCDARSDLFSLGSLIYTLCTARPPFQDSSVYGTMQKIANEDPVSVSSIRNDLPFWLDALVSRLLRKDRESRFQTADELCGALESELAALQSPETSLPPKRDWLPSATAKHRNVKGWLVPLCLTTFVVAMVMALVPPGGWLRVFRQPYSDGAGAASAMSIDEDEVDKVINNWVDRLVGAQGHNPIAFHLGPMMLEEQPDKAVQIAKTAWPRLRDRYQKTAMLKVFQFAGHEQILEILHLGMVDDDPDVRKYADSYLSEYTFRSFEGEDVSYTKWYLAHQNLTAADVLEEQFRLLAIELRSLGPEQGLEKWTQRKTAVSKSAQTTKAIERSGLVELFVEWFESDTATNGQKQKLLDLLTRVAFDKTKAESLFGKLATESPINELTLPAIHALIASDRSRTFTLLSDYIERMARQGKLPTGNSGLWELAQKISESGDDRFIPYMIGLIDADNSESTVYGVGYFGLGFSALGELTKVKYSPFHDGRWWRNWWDRNRNRFSKEASSIPIPEYPKTSAGKKYKPIEHDIETHEGRVALAEQMIRRKEFDRADDIAELFVDYEDQKGIPLLIGIIEADNSYDTVYGVGYFGLQKLVKPLRVRYSPYHDGAWWRRWWDRNKSNFSQEIQAIEIPSFPKSSFGRSYVPLPAELDTHAGRVTFVRNALAKKTSTKIYELCQVFELDEDPRDFAAVIGVMDYFDGKPEAKLVQEAIERQRSGFLGQSMPQTFEGWREWWFEHRRDWPETMDLDIYDFRKPPIPTDDKANAMRPRETSVASSDIDDVSSKIVSIDSYPKMQYYLIGDNLNETPKEQRKLAVVLPGGDGGKDFEPFVRRIRKHSLDNSWAVAQLVSVQWFPEQEIIWPTNLDTTTIYRDRPIDFATETFIDQVIDDVCNERNIPAGNVVVFGWSSSGPAVYAHSLTPTKRANKAYIAMSVFKPDRLPALQQANGNHYVIDHSAQDRVCAFRFAQQARSQLESSGAVVHSLDYTGGHGWQDNPFERIQTGMRLLTEK